MSAHPIDFPAPPPAPNAGAQLRARVAASSRAERWTPAFERDWAHALEGSRQTFDLSPLHDVIREWRSRLDTEQAVDAFIASGYDESGSVALEEVLGARP
ncbi:DUF6247 family protein [Streptacidiphilus sp. EB129]|uniref:DUF6247 family protein n=1 Tax=Streptacidiphilus sp. EB129 TaxID=3156262 RepID=UPI00351815D9